MVRVDVTGRDRFDPEVRSEVAQEAEATRVSALERPLELDVEAVSAEYASEAMAFSFLRPGYAASRSVRSARVR